MYADDTTLYCNNATFSQNIGEEVINAELSKIWEWLGANKLSLNIAKTKYMVFHTSKRNVIYPNLKVNNSNIERVTQFNFLGVILHSHMTWNKHINHFSMKIARSIGILYRLRNVYPESVLITKNFGYVFRGFMEVLLQTEEQQIIRIFFFYETCFTCCN